MKSSKKHLDKIEAALIAAYRRPGGSPIPSGLAATGDAGYKFDGRAHCFSPRKEDVDHDPQENWRPGRGGAWPRSWGG